MEFFRSEQMRQEVRESVRRLLIDKAIVYGDFILQSGKKSRYRLNVEEALVSDRDRLIAASLFLEKLPENTEAIGGMETGANLISRPVSMLRRQITPFTIFKNPKPSLYSCDQPVMIETSIDLAGMFVVIIDDVATTGESLLKAVYEVEKAGAKVIKIIPLVDRLEGARENIEMAGYEYDSIFTIDDLEIKLI